MAGIFVAGTLPAPIVRAGETSALAAAEQSDQATPPKRASGYPIGRLPESARLRYERTWGVDQFSVRLVESGALVRVSYLVTDADKAAPLHDRAATPVMADPQSGVMLHVPVMDKVGPLRQSTAPIAGKSYWMVFANVGGHVRSGDRVGLVIGSFRMDGLVVE